MNDKGFVAIYGLMLTVVIVILALAFATPVKQFIDDARAPSGNNSIGLDCNNSSISDFDKATCIATDTNLPLFVGGLIAIALSILGGAAIWRLL